jgi:hypothetical protein
MSVLKYEIKNLTEGSSTVPVPVSLSPLRPVAQRGYYAVVVLALLFNTIQQTTEPIRATALNLKAGQATSPRMCQAAIRIPDSIESSNCDFQNVEMVLMDLPGQNSNVFRNKEKRDNQVLKRKQNESIEIQEGERHVNDQSQQI